MESTAVPLGTLQAATEITEAKRKSSGRTRSISRLMPEVRRSIPALFDRMPAERVAEQFQVPKSDVIEEMLRHTRRELGLGPRPMLTAVRRRVA